MESNVSLKNTSGYKKEREGEREGDNIIQLRNQKEIHGEKIKRSQLLMIPDWNSWWRVSHWEKSDGRKQQKWFTWLIIQEI